MSIIDEYNFEEEINEYMKYAIIGKTIKIFNKAEKINTEQDANLLVKTIEEIKENVNRKVIYKDIEKKYFNFDKDIEKIEKAANDIKKNINKLNIEIASIKNMSISASDTNIKSVNKKLNTINSLIKNLEKSIISYLNSMDVLREKTINNKNRFLSDKNMEDFDKEVINFIEDEFEHFIKYVDKENEMNITVKNLNNFINMIKDDIYEYNENVESMVVEIDNLIEEKKELRKDKENDNQELIKDINETIKNIQNDIKQEFADIKEYFSDIEIENPYLMCSDEHSGDEKKIIENILNITKNGLLSLVLDKKDIENISNESVIKKELFLESKEDLKTKFLEIIYCIDFFNYYKKERSDEVTISGSKKLEVEEVIAKNNNDKDNLSQVLFKILSIRQCMNMLTIYTNSGMREKARMFTNTVFFFLSPIARKAVFFIVISAWGIAQSIDDIKKLMNGKCVRLIHDNYSWTFNINSILDINSQNTFDFNTNDEGLVLNYKDYLLVLLFLEKNKDINTNMAKIIDYNLKQEQLNFDIKKIFVSIETKNEFVSPYFFTNMIFLKPNNYKNLINNRIVINSYGKFYEK